MMLSVQGTVSQYSKGYLFPAVRAITIVINYLSARIILTLANLASLRYQSYEWQHIFGTRRLTFTRENIIKTDIIEKTKKALICHISGTYNDEN